MTAAVPSQPLTPAVLLFGEEQDTGQALAQALDEHGVLGSLDAAMRLVSQASREAADSQIATVADGLLDLDLGDLVVAGWRKHGRLAAAAERTAANPGTLEVVELATHRISSVHRPFVELLIDDVHMASVNFELDIEFVIKALVVTVRNGHVVSIHSGSCDVAIMLAAEETQLISQPTGPRRTAADYPVARTSAHGARGQSTSWRLASAADGSAATRISAQTSCCTPAARGGWHAPYWPVWWHRVRHNERWRKEQRATKGGHLGCLTDEIWMLASAVWRERGLNMPLGASLFPTTSSQLNALVDAGSPPRQPVDALVTARVGYQFLGTVRF